MKLFLRMIFTVMRYELWRAKSIALRQRVRTVPADQTLFEIWNNLSSKVDSRIYVFTVTESWLWFFLSCAQLLQFWMIVSMQCQDITWYPVAFLLTWWQYKNMKLSVLLGQTIGCNMNRLKMTHLELRDFCLNPPRVWLSIRSILTPRSETRWFGYRQEKWVSWPILNVPF